MRAWITNRYRLTPGSVPIASRRWWLPAGAIALTWSVIGAFPNRIYLGSDDATIAAIVNGTMSGVPDPHGIFISTALGSLMAGLSSLFPSVGWYGVVVWTILAIGLAGGALAIADILPEWKMQVLPMATLLAATAPLLFRLTFTTTSIVVGGISFLLLFAAARTKSTTGARFLLAWAIVSAIASLALRSEGFGAAALVMAPIAVAAAVKNWRLSLIFFASAGLALTMLSGIDAAAYSGSEWSEFMRFTEARSEIVDYFQVDPRAGLAAAGWTENDIAVYRDYAFFDSSIHGATSSSAFAAATSTAVRRPHLTPLISNGRFWILLCAIILVAAVMPGRHKGQPWLAWRFLGLFMVIWTSATSLAVGLWRFQWRVFDGMATVGLLAALLLVVMSWRSSALSRWTRITGFVLLLALIPAGYWQISNRAVNVTSTVPLDVYVAQIVEPFSTLDDDIVLIGEANAIQTWAVDPLSRSDIWDALPYQSSGWQTFSPVWWERSRQLGVERAPEALFDKENVIYLTYRPGSEERMTRFLFEHYGIAAVPCPMDIPGYPKHAWQFVAESIGCD